MEQATPSADDVRHWLVDRRNWGRWGDGDQRGAINLITAEKLVAAVKSVRTGQKVSLSRPLPTEAGPHNRYPVMNWWRRLPWKHGGGTAGDFLTMYCHGSAMTHLDALCHVWDKDGLYNGRDPSEITFSGAQFGGIENWSDGILTRGVLVDVPAFRGTDFVTFEEPVHGAELDEIVRGSQIELEPGDALCVFSGREAWQRAHPDEPYGHGHGSAGGMQQPGLHASCLPFLRDNDISLLLWDMSDYMNDDEDYGVPFTVHGAIASYGLALLDNALLEPLAAVCREQRCHDFLLVVAPLVARGATGSAVNPLAVL